MFAPARAPQAVVDRLGSEIAKITASVAIYVVAIDSEVGLTMIAGGDVADRQAPAVS